MIKLFKKEHLLYKIITLALLAGLVFFVLRVFYSVYVSFGYPRELLEPSNIALTRCFLDGKSPYTLNSLNYDIPAINYEYPFMGSLIAAGIVLISGCNAVTAHYLISSFAFLGTGVLGYIIIKPYTRTTVAPIASMILFMMCHWRFGYISAAPDDLGFFIFVLTLYFTISTKIEKKHLICAFMTCICFYTKQYFAFVAFGIFVYMLLYSKKDAAKFLLYTIVINAFVAIVITIVWPLYWTYSIFLLYNGTMSGIGFGIQMLIEQMKYLTAIFIGMFAVIIFAVMDVVIKRLRNKSIVEKDIIEKRINIEIKKNDAMPFFSILIVVMFLPLILLGKNDGAFLSYFLQLWMPSIIVVTLIVLEKMTEGYANKIWYIIAYGGIISFTILFGYLKLPFHIMTDEEHKAWEYAYAFVDEYKEKGEVYNDSLLAFKCMDEGDTNVFCGHDGEVTEYTGLVTWKNSMLWQLLFPYADDIIRKNYEYRDVLTYKGYYYGEYSLITFGEGRCMNYSIAFIEEKMPQYKRVDDIVLQVGNMPYTMQCYVRNDDIEAMFTR